MKWAGALLLSLLVTGCTGGHVSKAPMEFEGVGKVYRYQGKANFAHQQDEAQRMMTEHCKGINGGRPVIVSMNGQSRGFVKMGNNYIRSNSQVIYYKCKK